MEKKNIEEIKLLTQLDEATSKLHPIIVELYKDKDLSVMDGVEKKDSVASYNHILVNNLGKNIYLQMSIRLMPDNVLVIDDSKNSNEEK